MKILIIHQHFRLPSEGGSIRSYYLARGLSDRGNEVSVITASYNSVSHKKEVANFFVEYVGVSYDNAFGFIRRIISYSTFVVKVLTRIKRYKSYDCFYIMSTPLTVGLIGLFAKKFYDIRFAFEVGDIWPDIPIQMGILRNPFLKWIARKLETQIYKTSNLIVAISEPVCELIKNKTISNTILVVPNFSDQRFFDFSEKDPELEKKYQCQNKFVISYFGTLGIANKVPSLVYLAKSLGNDIKIYIKGGGAELSIVKRKIDELNVENVILLPFGSKDEVHELLNITDAVYISFDDRFPLLFTGCPNKLCDGLAAGKLIIINYVGWQKTLLEENRSGISLYEDLPENSVKKIRKFISSPELLTSYKENARNLSEMFELEKLIDQLQSVLVRSFTSV